MGSEVETAQTYRSYTRAFEVYCEHSGYPTTQRVVHQQSTLGPLCRLQPAINPSDDLRRHLFRGWLTLELTESLPLQQSATLPIGASMWLPVLTYFACHGVGLAALCALGCRMPHGEGPSHVEFLRMASHNIVKRELLVAPFNMRCTGHCDLREEEYEGTTVTREEVASFSNLTTPSSPRDAELLVAKCLKTTRKKWLDRRQAKERQDKKRKADRVKYLSRNDKRAICREVPPTTCFDFLFRMRICSNYKDAAVFLFGQRDYYARAHCRSVAWLAKVICAQLDNIIERKLGLDVFKQLRKQFEEGRL